MQCHIEVNISALNRCVTDIILDRNLNKIYGNYDIDALNAQYDLRPLWPDVPEVIKFRETESARVRQELSGCLDLSYDQGEGNKLDVFSTSDVREPGPALIYIHGGYWQLSDKNDTTYIAPAFLSSGISFISINYTLAPKATMDQIVTECRNAVRWIYRNSLEFGVDNKKLFLAGHSAGGHLTAMMLATDWNKYDPEMPRVPINGACALSGVYNLEPVRLSFLNKVLGLKVDDALRNSPIYLEPVSDVPLILSVGGRETDEFKRQQNEFLATWSAKGLGVTEISAPNCHHYTIVEHFGDPESALHQATIAMIRKD